MSQFGAFPRTRVKHYHYVAVTALQRRPAVIITGEDYRDQHVAISRRSIAETKIIETSMSPPISRIKWLPADAIRTHREKAKLGGLKRNLEV